MSEALNPNHPITQQFASETGLLALLAIMVSKYGTDGTIIVTVHDVEHFEREFGPDSVVVIDNTGTDYLRPLKLRLLSREEGERLARREGGMPV